MKKYLIKVTNVKSTFMIVSEKSMKTAVMKTSNLLDKYVNNGLDLNEIFDEEPHFFYKVKLLKKG